MKYGRTSDIGTRRLENQDAVAILTNSDFSLLLLCDGMGGHYGGGIASSTTISIFEKEFKQNFPALDSSSIEPFVTWIKNTVNVSKKEMIKISDRDEAKLDMGTTVTGALINTKKKYVLIFNIGDSRTFVLSTSGELTQVTVDHNYLNQLISEGVPEIEAKKYWNQASLTSALGPDKRTKLEILTIGSNDYDRIYSLISTSDGAHDFVPKPIFENIARQNKDAETLTREIIDFALKNNSTDNATCGMIILDNPPKWRS
ncbi:PP2C family protein-serine/threonine phosphatase [Mycoplasmopsis primatum]|uniref:PP2C family protein-serine/threonine phosphatase n=1 Tax=Mycoplasmopsis primatum TaxID=55604 RepID=UPI0004979F51|nr:PP2C family serine/threonine-protein phosphatase [Mycoplasmopsis primatum]